jgi:outer membrane protein
MRFVAPLLALSLTASVAGFAAPLSADTAAQIAVVVTQRMLMETEDGLRLQATLRKLFDARQMELDKKQNDLQRERENLEKQRGVLSPEALGQRAEKWQMEVAQVQQMFSEYSRELQQKQNELMQPIRDRAVEVVRKLATQEGFLMVIDKQVVPYVRTDLDLTERLISAYNAGPSAQGPAAPAGKPAAGKPAAAPAAKPAAAPGPVSKGGN